MIYHKDFCFEVYKINKALSFRVIFVFFVVLLVSFSNSYENNSVSNEVYKTNNEIYKTNRIFELYYNQKFSECRDYCYDVILSDVDNSAAYVFYFSSSYMLDKLQDTINDIDAKYVDFIQKFNSVKRDEIIESQKEYQYLTIMSGFSNIFLSFASNNGSFYLDEALNILRRSLFFPVSYSSIYTGIGIVYYEKKINEKAISMIQKALNIKPDDPIALEYYGKINNNLGNYQQTISKLKNYTFYSYPDLIYQLAFAYEKNGDLDKAIDTYLLSFKYDPYLLGQGFISLIRVGDIYLYTKKDKQKAINYYQEVLKILPDSLVAKSKIEEAKNYNDNNNKVNSSNEKKKEKKKK